MPLYLGNSPVGGVKTSVLGDSVLYTEQNLTEKEKAQARENIGAISIDEVNVTVDTTISETSENPIANKTVKSYVDTKVADIVESAPETLDTLNELAAALGDDPNFATTVATQIGNKVDKIDGKGLSTNDYTTAEKEKLAGIAAGATKVTSPSDIGAASNPNLIDNWYLTDPVNQRGLTEYTGGGYTIDRWINYYSDGVVTITDRGVKLSGMKWLIQRFDNLDFVGRAITASVLFADGEFCYGSLVYNGGVQRFCVSNGNAVYVEMVDNGGASDPEFRLVNYSETAEKTIIAVKLELGDKQTLARQDENGNWILNDPPPDKGLELLKCIQSTADPGDTYANKVVYHTGNKPTAEDIGALPIKKGYYVGNIDEITEGAYLVLANATGDMPFTTTWFDLVAIPSGTGAISQIAMCSSVTGTPTQFKFRHHNGEGWSSWSEAATTNYAVNRGGDTMSGDLAITNSRPTLCLTNSGDTEHIGKVLAGTYNMFIGYEGGATSYNILIGKDTNQYTLSNILRLAKVENGVETLYPILHTGNKNLITPNDIGAASTANAETWVFTLADGSTVSKEVILK